MNIKIYINDDKISIDKPTIKKKHTPVVKSRSELFSHVDFRYADIFTYNPLSWSIRTKNILETNIEEIRNFMYGLDENIKNIL